MAFPSPVIPIPTRPPTPSHCLSTSPQRPTPSIPPAPRRLQPLRSGHGSKREERASPAPQAVLERTHNHSLARARQGQRWRAVFSCTQHGLGVRAGHRCRADLYDSIELVHGGRARKCWFAPQHLFETGVSLSNLNTAVSPLHPIMCGMTAAVWPPARVVHVPCTFHRPCETSPRRRGQQAFP